jgi:hypothetical protein
VYCSAVSQHEVEVLVERRIYQVVRSTTTAAGELLDPNTGLGALPAHSERSQTMATKRTTHRSASGKKLYAKRSKTGQFKDIQTYKRAHGQDVKRKSKREK